MSRDRPLGRTLLVALALVGAAAATATALPSPYPDTVIASIWVGGDPHGVAVLAGSPRLYVGNESFNGVFVVDLDARRVIDTITCGEHPWQLTVTPDDQRVYVCNLHGNSVSVINTATNTVIATIPVGAAPHPISCHPDGSRVYVGNIDSDNVSVIRTSDNTVIATIPVGIEPRGLCILPSGEYVYTANSVTDNVSVIRTSDNTVVRTISVPGYPHRAVSSRDGAYVYISTTRTNYIAVIRTSDNTVVGTVPAGGPQHGGCYLPSADYAYITSPEIGRLTVIRTSDNTVAGTIQVGTGCCEATASVSGDRVYTPDRSVRSVSVIARRQAIDVGATQIIAPIGDLDSGAVVTPRAVVRNFGPASGSFPVTMTIGSSYRRTVLDTLAPNASDTVGFPAWTAAPVGTLPVACFTTLAGDTNPANDTVSNSVRVAPPVLIDVAVTATISPARTVDSGVSVIPAARVSNPGVVGAVFPVTLKIGTRYFWAVSETLAAGAVDTVAFPAWTPDTVGTLPMTCYTSLAGDRNPTNDTIRDSVAVTRPVLTDASVTAILSPPASVDSGSVVTPRAVVVNLSATGTTFPVTMRIGTSYAWSVSETLAVGATDTVTFPDWTADAVGTYPVVCYTSLAGDQNRANDTLRDSVTVQRRYATDVGVTAILAPDSVVDSGAVIAPLAVIENRGSDTAMFPVTLRIGSGYAQVRPETLAAGARDTLVFPVWTASPPGTYALTCYCTLVGDENPANDTLARTVRVTAPQEHDVGPDSLFWPAAGVHAGDTVVPKVRIHNWGTGPERYFDVACGIGTGYSSTRTVQAVLPVGGSAIVTFDPWVAEAGNWNLTAVTQLAPDANRGNDTLVAVVQVPDQPGLIVEWDQSDFITTGQGKTFWFWAEVHGQYGDTVELVSPNVPAGWSVELMDSTGIRPAATLGYVLPGNRVWFAAVVRAPADLSGDTAAISTMQFAMAARLRSDRQTRDSAILTLTVTPEFEVHNFPNPFCAQTTFIIGLPHAGTLTLTIHNRAGETVARLLTGETVAAGVQRLSWRPLTDAGQRIAPGTYDYVLDYAYEGASRRLSKKLVVTSH